MARVVPAWRLVSLLNDPRAAMKRKALDENRAKQKLDGDWLEESKPAFNESTFDEALRKASRKLPVEESSQPDEGKSET